MKKFIEKILSNPVILLVALHNEIGDFIKYLIEYKKLEGFRMQINWQDAIFRVVVCLLLWLLYRSYLKHKKATEAKIKELEAKAIRLNSKILIADKLNNNADITLKELWTESRDRTDANMNMIIDIFKERLNVTGIGVNKEHPEITKYKGKLNVKMDEEETGLREFLYDNEGLE